MSNRMDIELTSARDDGTFTWRAAGARQPKGVLDAALITPGSKIGDVLRVEAEVEIDGITILSVLPSKGKKGSPAGQIEILSPSKPVPGVTTVLVSEGGRGRKDRGDLLDSRRQSGRSGTRDRRSGHEAQGRGGAPSGDRTPAGRPGERAPGARAGGRPDAGAPAASDRRPERRPRSESAGSPGHTAGARGGAPGDQRRPDGTRPGTRPDGREAPARRGPPRFEPGTKHRDEMIAALSPEQRPIAERLAIGGLPAVRRAVAEERERARAEGRPEATGEAILTIAEQLQPAVKQATWLDRADAAAAQLDKISLRDLRTTVIAAAPRDDEGRELARKLREELDRRVTKLRTTWEEQMVHALEEGRVLQALRLSAQPPEPTARFPASLVHHLAEKSGAAMASDTPPERWLAMLEAAAASPIRRQIHPAGIPEDPTGEIQRQARIAAGSLPALAPLLGLTMPPPPKPVRSAKPPRPPRPPRPAKSAASRGSAGSAGSDEGGAAHPAPAGASIAPVEPELTPAPVEPELTPAPVEPELTPAPVEPELGSGAPAPRED